MKTFAISIPKPCHEDWNKMTPDAKGAFCGSCQKSVYDFSNKSDEEILEVFEKKGKEKVCGRFTPSQLSRPVVTFGNASITNRLAVFAYALLMVFGSALFIGTEAFGQGIKGEANVRMGKVRVKAVEQVTQVEKDTIVQENKAVPAVCGINTIVDYRTLSLGQAVVIEQPVMKITGDTIFQESPLAAEINTEPVTEDLPVLVDSTRVELPILIEPEMYVAGGVSYIEIEEVATELISPVLDTAEAESLLIIETTPDEDEAEIKSALVSEPVIIPFELDVKVSPNPTSGQITLSYTLENIMPVRIDLFDITGKIVKMLSNQGKQYAGKYNVSYNISDLPNGIYMATLSTNDNKVSAKVILAK